MDKEEVGSFILFSEGCPSGSVFTLQYKPEHAQITTFQFLNDKENAVIFAMRKTKIDKKLFR